MRSFNRIAVIGAAGFIGSNFCEYLKDDVKFEGNVLMIDALTYAGDRGFIRHLEDQKWIFSQINICDVEKLRKELVRFKPELIINFSAETHVDNSIKDPMTFIQTNIVGLVNLLNISKELNSLKLFHQVSTDEVYGALTTRDAKFTEESKFRANNPYSASKASGDLFVRAYANTYGIPVTISNCSNNFGKNQNKEKLIPKAIDLMVSGEDVPIYGDGNNVRDWMHVYDHCTALWLIVTQSDINEVWNIGADHEISNNELMKLIHKELKELYPKLAPLKIKFVEDRLGHDFRYGINSTKLQNKLRWIPKYTLENGLREYLRTWRDSHNDNI